MSARVILCCFFAASLVTDAAVVVAKDEVVVGAKAHQHLMRKDTQADKPCEDTDFGCCSDGKTARTSAHDDCNKDSSTSDAPAADSAKSDAPAALAKSVHIALYYETRCPDCIEFINKTLEPLWRSGLKDNLNITMNPYGNSMSLPVKNVSEGYKFFHPATTGDKWNYVHICQHGSDECFGNLVQACAMDKVKQHQYMELVFCMASLPEYGVEKSSYECMGKAKINQTMIKECVNSPHGNELMAEFGKKTAEVKDRQGTPWVMVDGVNLMNVTDLMRTACHSLANGPASCAHFKGEKAPAAEKKSEDEPAADEDDFPVLAKLKTNQKLKDDLVTIALNIPNEV